MTQDQSPQKAGFYDHEFEKLNEKSNLHPHLPYHLLYRYTSWLYPPSPSLPWFSTSSIFSFWSYSSHRSLDPRREQDETRLDQWGGYEAARPPPSPSLHQVSSHTLTCINIPPAGRLIHTQLAFPTQLLPDYSTCYLPWSHHELW